MSIFTRFRDIVTSNINAILDHAEDPEKMVRLMILEMEDTLVEVKSNCAAVMADQKKLERLLRDLSGAVEDWEAKARLAIKKDRDDLARAALSEKRRTSMRTESLKRELEMTKDTVANFQSDIVQLESKLNDAREKQNAIIQRRTAAVTRRQAQQRIRKIDTSSAFAKFEAYENGIEKMEAEAELTDSFRPKKKSLHAQFADLEYEDEVEAELNELKEKSKQQ